MGSEPVCPECLCVIDSDTGCACPDTTTCTICGTRVEGVGVEHQRECNGALWRTRAHAAEEELRENEGVIKVWRRRTVTAERRAAVLAAMLGCAGEVAAKHAEPEWGALNTDDPWFVPHIMPGTWLRFLATDPHELMRLVPATRRIIETALGAAGLTINDLEEQD